MVSFKYNVCKNYIIKFEHTDEFHPLVDTLKQIEK